MSLKSLTKTLTIGAVASLMFGCSSLSSPPPTAEISGAKVDITELSGSWEGRYTSTVTQRSGVITLDLDKANHKAVGSILFKSEKKYKKLQTPKGVMAKKSGTQIRTKPLPVEFVAVKDGEINGVVTPYTDPKFGGKTVFTTFKGTLVGNRMEGKFTSRIGQNGNSYEGSWWAVRK